MQLMSDSGPIEEAFFDGYGIEERLLEGVMFRVIIKDDEVLCTGARSDHSAYMKKFSKSQKEDWCKEILAIISRDPSDAQLVTENGEEAWIEDCQIHYHGVPIEVEGLTGEQLMEKLNLNPKSG